MAEEFIPCIPKELPPELSMASAKTAIEINPANAPASAPRTGAVAAPSPLQIAALTTKWWGAGGVRLTTAFTESIQNDLRNRILEHLNLWNEFANVQFVYSTTDPMVRITRELEGYWSYLGTDILHIAKSKPTMCLSRFTMQTPLSEVMRVATHEGGHSISLIHEHTRPSIIKRIDPQKAIPYFWQTNRWSAEMVYSQVLTPQNESDLTGSPEADEESLMAYPLPGSITYDGLPIIGGTKISKKDAEFIARMYPKEAGPAPPDLPPSIVGDLASTIDFKNKVFSVRLPDDTWKAMRQKSRNSPFSIPIIESVRIDENFCEEREPMSALAQSDLNCLADELEAALPPGTPEGADAAIGGPIGSFIALIAAMRAGDWKAIAVAFRDLLDLILGEGDGGISFAQKAVLKKLLPSIKLG